MHATIGNKMTRAATWQNCLHGDPNQNYGCGTGPITVYDPSPLWCETDTVGGAVWIDNATKHGIVYLSTMVDRVNDAAFRTNNYAGGDIPHEWYSIQYVDCCHGHKSTGEGTGPHTPSVVPQLWIYDPATILSSAAGSITTLQAANTPATSHKHLRDYSTNFPFITTEPYRLNCCYDHNSRLFFVCWGNVDPVDPPYAYYPEIHVFEVAN